MGIAGRQRGPQAAQHAFLRGEWVGTVTHKSSGRLKEQLKMDEGDRATSEIKLQVYRDKDKKCEGQMYNLCAETVERAPRALQCVDDVESGDGLPLCVLSVCYRVANDLKEN
jgi:hypothetical protein